MIFQQLVVLLTVALYSNFCFAGPILPGKAKVADGSHAVEQAQPSPKYLFITGDSWTTTKFNYGGPQPSAQNPLGNSAGTFSGGANWVNVLADDMPDGTLVYNFAVGGNLVNLAHSMSHFDFIKAPVKDLIGQDNELENLSHRAHWDAGDALAINWFGINDVNFIGMDNAEMRSPYTIYGVLNLDMADYFGQLERQYSLGVRHFVVPLAPPLQKTPLYAVQRADKIPLLLNYLNFWNDGIKTGVALFKERHGDAKVAVFDSAPVFDNVVGNFAQYGAPDATCVSNPQGQPCLWWDPIHPGIVLNRELGKAMFEAVKSLGFV